MIALYIPDRLACLTEAFLESLMNSIIFGTESSIQEVCQMSFEIISTIAKFFYCTNNHGSFLPVPLLCLISDIVLPMSGHLDNLLCRIFDTILFKEYNSNIFGPMTNALFFLFLLRKVNFLLFRYFYASRILSKITCMGFYYIIPMTKTNLR